MAPSGIKLTYFNARGRAEPARLILAQAGIEYEDIRIEREEWAALKPKIPMGQLPCMEVEGKTICQSMAIARYCASRYGLTGNNALEAALADQAVDAVNDLITELVKVMHQPEEAKKAELAKVFKDEKLPVWLTMMETVLKKQGGKHFTGSSLSWADIIVFHIVSSLKDRWSPDMSSHPCLSSLVTMVGSLPNIKAWIQKRPVTEM